MSTLGPASSRRSVVRHLLDLTLPAPALSPRAGQFLLIAAVTCLGLAMAWLPLNGVILLLGGVIYTGLILLRPVLSVLLLIPLIPFSPLVAISPGSFRLGAMELVLASGLIAWLMQLSVKKSPPVHNITLRSPLLVPFFLFLGSVSFSWLNSLSIGASLIETLKWVEMLALYVFVISALPVQHIKWVVAVILLAGVAQALLGLYQFLFKVGPEGFLLFGGRFLRAYGAFAQPNPYAGYLGLVLPLALALAVWGVTGKLRAGGQQAIFSISSPKFTALYVFLFGLLLAAMFASQSRGAWVGFAAAAALVLAVHSKRMLFFLLAAALLIALVTLVGTFESTIFQMSSGPGGQAVALISQRLESAFSIVTIDDIGGVEVNDANFALIERLAHWQAAQEMWRDHPWLGVGFGNYEVIYPAYAVGRWFNPLGHAHNYLLNIGAETGVVGISGYIIFWILAFGVTYMAVYHSTGFDQAVAAGVLGILAHLHVHNLFDNLYVQGMYLHLAIVLALASIIYYKHSQRRQEIPAWEGNQANNIAESAQSPGR